MSWRTGSSEHPQITQITQKTVGRGQKAGKSKGRRAKGRISVVMNYFSFRSAAERYARGRLYFHPLIVSRIRKFLSLKRPVSDALDVGCGTGLSTVALKEIARHVIGVDASAEMLALAPRGNGLTFLAARAENLPFREAEFDLISVAQVIHWVERDGFLREANRILHPGGWLVVYDDYFSPGEAEDSELGQWYKTEYLERYPAPPRAEITFTAENTEPFGFRLMRDECHQHRIALSLTALTDYLVTQSNVIAVVEGGKETIEETRARLMKGLAPLFRDAREKNFLFNAPIWYLVSNKQ
jgi:ubiquinone/menaquinone biosynthesis C-methylase UbiE